MESLVMENLFGGIYKGKTVLITGNTGFKGSWLALWLQKLGANVIGYSLPAPTNPSHFEILKTDYETITGNILELNFLKQNLSQIKPVIVFHLAAQSLVRESYLDAVNTYETNVIGTLNVFESARNCESVKAIVNVTTDKVYRNSETQKAFSENDALGGHDMYSSSKACSEILTESYRKSFFDNSGILLASARAGNVIGGGDWSNDRLIPDVVKATGTRKKVMIRYPDSIRPWQHVLEPLSGYLFLGKKLLEEKQEFAKGWNFGPQLSDCVSVKTILKGISAIWQDVQWEIDQNENPHETQMLMLDSAAAKKELHWKPVWNLGQALSKTMEWYKSYYSDKKILTEIQLDVYSSMIAK
ncbi:MAG: CDP-glucose 4,6-dehydratase [Bacteroidia bacterium]|nr:CDP-glucose 4,6-dehydratase [Bacteroidia bacterium]